MGEMKGERLRVLLIANTLPPVDVSGVGEQVLQLAGGLREAGCEVEVLGRGEGGARGPKVMFPLTVVPAAWQALRRFRPHVVQVHESDGGLAALLVKALGRFLRPRPLLVALQQVSYAEERRAVRPLVDPDGRVMGEPGDVERRFRRGKGRVQVMLGKGTARLADLVMAPSERTAGEIRKDYGVDDVAVLPNVTGGIPREVGGGSAEASAGAPAEAKSDSCALLFVGRLRIRKGVEVLLEALALESREGRSARLLVAGDGEHREALERKAAELGLEDTVTFLGRRAAAEVRGLLAACRALVVPSTYEGMPLVVLEAMEAGVPVIASAVSGIPEVVVDGETGWLVPREEPQALAGALRQALADPDEAQRRGRAGRRRLDDHYRPRHAARRWLEAVRDAGVTAGAGGGTPAGPPVESGPS